MKTPRAVSAVVARWWAIPYVLLCGKRIRVYLIAPEKSGSTSIAVLLNEHPALTYGAVKESHVYRASGKVPVPLLRLADRVIHLGPREKKDAMMFDASTSNSTNPFAAHVLRNCSSRARVIFLFRDPVDRFVSQYRWDRRNGWTQATRLAEYLGFCLEERVVRAQARHYSARRPEPITDDFAMQATSGSLAALLYGRYADIVARYAPFDSIALELEDFSADYAGTITKIADFLGIDAEPFRRLPMPHERKAPGREVDQAEQGWDDAIRYLVRYYREHNAGLERLCKRRFSFSA